MWCVIVPLNQYDHDDDDDDKHDWRYPQSGTLRRTSTH